MSICALSALLWHCVVSIIAAIGVGTFADSYARLMEPILGITEAHRDCGWTFIHDLPTVAQTSSKFEPDIVIKEDTCGNKALVMGGFLQAHAADEHVYHEMLVHPAMATFAAVNSRAASHVFLGGSGEGAGAREILRWPTVQQIMMVDIDATITNFTRKWIPSLANGSFEDPRLILINDDAIKYLEDMPDGETFDVLIMDFPDPFDVDALKALYSRDFYELCKSRMHSGSILVTQSGPCSGASADGGPMYCEVLEKLILTNMAYAFPQVDVLMHPMATWKAEEHMASEWSTLAFGWNPETLDQIKFSKGGLAGAQPLAHEWLEKELGSAVLRYYNGSMHLAAADKPAALQRRVAKELRSVRTRQRFFSKHEEDEL